MILIPSGTNATGYDVFSIPRDDYHNGAGRRFKAMEYYRLRDKAANACRVLIEDDTCRDAWSNHSMEVTCVKQAFDSLFLSTSAVRSP